MKIQPLSSEGTANKVDKLMTVSAMWNLCLGGNEMKSPVYLLADQCLFWG